MEKFCKSEGRDGLKERGRWETGRDKWRLVKEKAENRKLQSRN